MTADRESKFQTITKIDALQRQVSTAIWMYFEERDPVALHTITTAAAEIANRLCQENGFEDPRTEVLNVIPEHLRKQVGTLLNTARNFFKHGGNSDASVSFNEDMNFFLLMQIAQAFRLLGLKNTEIRVLATWAAYNRPEWFDSTHPVFVEHTRSGKKIMAMLNPRQRLRLGLYLLQQESRPPGKRPLDFEVSMEDGAVKISFEEETPSRKRETT